jgi:hypothetical protein
LYCSPHQQWHAAAVAAAASAETRPIAASLVHPH